MISAIAPIQPTDAVYNKINNSNILKSRFYITYKNVDF